jgi:hypothetical protein
MIGQENDTRTSFRRQKQSRLEDRQSSTGIRRVRCFILNGGNLARHGRRRWELLLRRGAMTGRTRLRLFIAVPRD